MSLINRISESIKTAMKEKDSIKLESLRAVKSALILLQTEKGSGSQIPKSEEIKTLQKLVKQRKDSAEIYRSQNRSDLAELEINQSKVIEDFLPQQISEDELRKIITNIIDQNEASGMKDMGKVMGIATKELLGKADGKTISALVKSLLI
ncbi:MAG: glutamyl-tRNA amidotransferase [Flavobacteriaceae bacterium]|nr:glutamyl-tRNA amidotransferase [Flavobacteriaceae bacterium]|tara:strand:+ start:3862 stop:4311 length:450 start_codon:yes stop_codon:yes gene_type:complete